MRPELFEIPFLGITIKSYGLMMVVGFAVALYIARRLSRTIPDGPNHFANAALYTLVGGVIGARLFYVIHYYDSFRGDLASIFAVWHGGMEFLGGVIFAIAVLIFYIRYYKLPMRKFFDICAIVLMAGLAFGRIGCLLNGCCFGQPTDMPWAITFPYGSFAHRSHVQPDPDRNRPYAYIELSDDYFNHYRQNGHTVKRLKSWENLTANQQEYLIESGKARSVPVHPTQIYSSLTAVLLAGALYGIWRIIQNGQNPLYNRPGYVFSVQFILYGIVRFVLEMFRGDNPIERTGLTISQNLSLALIILGVILVIFFYREAQNSLKTK